MRRTWIILITIALLLSSAAPLRAEEAPLPDARAYLLMDATTGEVLTAQNPDAELPIASTTKMMTTLIALERGNLNDVVTVGEKPYGVGGTSAYLEIGERQTLGDLLYAVMLVSANDASIAVAEHLAGSEEQFVALMNQKAQAIGATHTHFANSHGLHDPQHHSTAHDLALIARYAMQNPAFRALVATETHEMPGPPGKPPRELVNHNQLLGYYPGSVGVKNGFTEEAGLTNVTAAKRGDTELIAVLLGMQSLPWTNSMKLLDWGFDHYETRQAAYGGLIMPGADVPGLGHVTPQVTENRYVSVPVGSAPLTQTVEWLSGLAGLATPGRQIGLLRVWQGDQEVAQVPLKVADLGPSATAATGSVKGAVILGLGLWGAFAFTLTLRRSRSKGGSAHV